MMANPFGVGNLASMGVPGGNGLQGAGLLETMELVRKAWSSFALPPGMAPTVDPDEIERRVAELKAVEQWLVMNLTMLRGTIQALEIQQHTLATLRAFGATGSAPGPSADGGGASAAVKTGWPHPEAPESEPEPVSAPAPKAVPESAPDATADQAQPRRPQASTPSQATAEAAAAMNPVAWWDMLQKQFGQIAAAALASMPTPGATQPGASEAAADVASVARRPARAGPKKAASAKAPGKTGVSRGRKASARKASSRPG
jgi:hypothetical protein